MNILLVCGSLRKNSFNKILAEDAIKALENQADGPSARLLDYTGVPFFNADIEFPAPAAVEQVRKDFAWADAVWFVTPEYNGFLPGVLKNLLDWMSRPQTYGSARTNTPLYGKPACISGAGGGRATQLSREQLTTLLKFLGMKVCPDQLGIALPPVSFQSNSLDAATKEEIAAKISAQAEAFVTWIHSLSEENGKTTA